MSQKFCTQCGSHLPETGNFCPACGAARAQTDANPQPAAAAQVALSAPVSAPAASASPARKRQSPFVPGAILGGALLIGVALWFLFVRPQDSIANVEACVVGQLCADETPMPLQEGSDIPFPEVVRIPPAKAKAGMDAGNALFVDVRDAESFAEAHIPGSVLMPLDEIPALGAQLPTDRDIILYCT